MAHVHELRLMARVARLYHERGLSQREIAGQLELSQPTVSRLLKRAVTERIVRVVVTHPSGTHSELEEGLQKRYGLREAMVVETATGEDALLRDLGAAAAYYLETTLRRGEVVGLSSWSATLLAMVDSMRVLPRPTGSSVVQILGGVGSPEAEVHAAHLTQRLARLVGGEARLLPAPGVVGSAGARTVLFEDRFVREAMARLERVTVALVGVGALEPSRLLAASGNVFAPRELEKLRRKGAVGDVCLRFFDAGGEPIRSELDGRVIGMTLEQLRKARKTIGIAGGRRKYEAVLGALRGRWVNVLITDRGTADRLVVEPDTGQRAWLPDRRDMRNDVRRRDTPDG
jgi:DNA-binding transcriptional regulator LsrR (DeoR family)